MNDSTTNMASLRGKIGMAKRWGTEADVAEAKRNLATANLEKYIQKVVSEAPPLTEDQREHLASLLMGGEK